MRNIKFAEGEYYHVFNRGTDKRTITENRFDSERFVQSLAAFNTKIPIGSIYKQSFEHDNLLSNPVTKLDDPLVDIVAFCLNPNHYHALITPLVDGGLSKFMQRFGTGYTRYYNERYERTGVLFQGPFKARHISDNNDLLRISAYINLNNIVHRLNGKAAKLVHSSWQEYNSETNGICDKGIILEQFANAKAYKKFAEDTVRDIIKERIKIKDLEEVKEIHEFYLE